MCGILAIWSKKQKIERSMAEAMLSTLLHRGKDNVNLVFPEQNVALGHTRLSIIDLSENANQPISNENHKIWLTFNGEIYNYQSLREELQLLGHNFKSQSDVEVVVHGYEQWGTNVLSKLNGMFAFVIYDDIKQQFFLARDRFGIKPLYYSLFDKNLIVASEIKAIIKHYSFVKNIEPTSFSDYFVYRYIPSPKTIYKNVFKLSPASYLIIDNDFNINTYQYWDVQIKENIFSGDITDEVQQRLLSSVEMHLQSDVPVGIFLSSGLDSSTIAYLTKKAKYNPTAFTIGFDGWKQSEHIKARTIAQKLDVNYQEKILNQSSINNIDESVYNYDEPIADISVIPTYEISRFASSYVKTVLSGEGGDEIFAGYTWYKNLIQNWNIYSVVKYFNKDVLVNYYALAMAVGLFDKEQLQALLTPEYRKNINDDVFYFYRKHFRNDVHPLKALQYLDLKTFLPELVLTKVDRASMSHTLEVRVPFLNHQLVEFMFSLHPSLYYKLNEQKFILQNILKNKLDISILKQKKQGFVGPDSFYKQKSFYIHRLSKSQLAKEGFLNQSLINKYLNNNDFWRLWKILIIENWFTYWFMKK